MGKKSSGWQGTESSPDLVVVHTTDGNLIKGILQVTATECGAAEMPCLPPCLHIRGENSGDCWLIELREAKAVFFVKQHHGILDHEEVKFFAELEATDLWVRIRFADGEVLEGQMGNDTGLLLDPGIWLRPFDTTGNNVLVYVPKSSVREFHIMGVAQHSTAEDRPDSGQVSDAAPLGG